MLDGQGQLLSFLDVGRSDDDRFSFSGQKVEEVVTETGSLEGDFNEDVFRQMRGVEGEFALSVYLLGLAGDGGWGQKQVFRLAEEVD